MSEKIIPTDEEMKEKLIKQLQTIYDPELLMMCIDNLSSTEYTLSKNY